MKLKKRQINTYFFVVSLLISNTIYSQIGINTDNPKASLHIEASNPLSPENYDGILVPRLNTLPSSGNTKGQLIFLENTSSTSGFYIWNGEIWDPIIKQSFDRFIDESIYLATGNNTGNTYTSSYTESNLIISSILGNNTNGFSVANNSITIGKSGTYLINVSSSLKTTAISSGGRRATFKYTLKKSFVNSSNATIIQELTSATSSIPNENTTSTNIIFSDIVNLKQGDKLFVTRMKLSDNNNSQNIGILPFGNNTIRLTFLK